MKNITHNTRCVKHRKKLATVLPASVAGTQQPHRPILLILLAMIWRWLFPSFHHPGPPPNLPAVIPGERQLSLFEAALDISLTHGYHAVRWEVVGC